MVKIIWLPSKSSAVTASAGIQCKVVVPGIHMTGGQASTAQIWTKGYALNMNNFTPD